MNTDQLRAFLHVADLGSQSRAAERLHVTQPALSRRLQQLEQDLQVTLFERTGRGMRLSREGQELRRRVAPLVQELDQIAQDLKTPDATLRGEVRIATPPSVGVELTCDVIEHMRREHPLVQMHAGVALTGEIREQLQKGSLDMGVLYQPVRSKTLHAETLFREELCVISRSACAPTNARQSAPNKARQRARETSPRREAGGRPSGVAPSLGLREALALPLILPAPRHGLRALLEHHALHLGQELQVVVEADSLRLLVELVSRGLGHTMLPIWAVREEIRQERLVATSIKRGALRRESVLVWPNDRPLSPSAEAVAAALRKLARAQRRARA